MQLLFLSFTAGAQPDYVFQIPNKSFYALPSKQG